MDRNQKSNLLKFKSLVLKEEICLMYQFNIECKCYCAQNIFR